MNHLQIITPVKDSLETTLKTIEGIRKAEKSFPSTYTVYNDFSSENTTECLAASSQKYGYELVNLKDITSHPSPNYLLVLQMAQKKALSDGAHLLIIESDVVVEPNTIQKLYDYCSILDRPGMIASVTVDIERNINFPYLYARNFKSTVISTKKRLSFCCTLLTNDFLQQFDFGLLNPEKSWYDVFISHKSIELGFNNYLITALPVLHLPHSSRPWKLLKYSNPIKYYWRKLIDKRDKI